MGYITTTNKIDVPKLRTPTLEIDQVPPGCVLLWRPRRTDNLWYDQSGRGNHGSIVEGKWVVDPEHGHALVFDTGSGYVQVNNARGLPPNQITVSAWVKIVAHHQWNVIVFHDHWTHVGGWTLMTGPADPVTANGYFSVTQIAETLNIDGVTTGLQTGGWYNLVGTYDEKYVRLFVDGVESPTKGTLADLELDHAGNLTVAAGYDGASQNFDGLVGEIRVYDRALTPQEVSSLYYSGRHS